MLQYHRGQIRFFIPAILLFFLPLIGLGQLKKEFVSYGNIFNNGTTQIELQVKIIKNPCDVNNTAQNMFRLNFQNLESRFVTSGYFLNWKMKVTKCDGNILIKTVSISLSRFNQEGLNSSTDWTFDGESVENTISAKIEPYPNNDKDFVIQNVKSVPPKSIQGKQSLITGESSTLSISSDAKLGTKAQWVWYENNCGGISTKRGSSINIAPSKTTTYYVRAESPTDTSDCRSIKVEVDDDSKITNDTKVIGPKTVCPDNNKISLEVFSGKLGYKANWVWYKSGCGSEGERINTGSKIDVEPTKTTTYYVRAEGATNTTPCISHTVTVSENVDKPSVIIGESSICVGQSTTIKAVYPSYNSITNSVWYADQNLTKRLNSGDSLRVSPYTTTTYYVRSEGFCNKSEAISKTISVNQISIAANSIEYKKIKGRTYSLKAIGGVLGSGAIWNWSEGTNCKENNIGTGAQIEYKAKKLNKIHVHAEGDCNTTNCTTLSFTHQNSNKKNGFVFLNAGIISSGSSFDGADNVMATIGWKKFYVRFKSGIKKNENGSEILESYEYGNNSLNNFPINSTRYYEMNGEKYIKRSSFTGGFMTGGDAFRLYVGGGFGAVKPFYGLNIVEYSSLSKSKSWALDIDNQYSGLEVEAGVFIKLGFLNIMGGISSVSGVNSKRYIDGHAGIGLTF